MAEQYSIIYMYVCVCTIHIHFFIYSSINRHLECFLVLAIINNTMNMGVQIPFELVLLCPLDIVLEVELLEHMIVLLLVFFEESLHCFP